MYLDYLYLLNISLTRSKHMILLFEAPSSVVKSQSKRIQRDFLKFTFYILKNYSWHHLILPNLSISSCGIKFTISERKIEGNLCLLHKLY